MLTEVPKLLCERWHESHLLAPVVTGMCDAGLPVAVLPLWQESQVPVPTALAAEWAKLADDQLDVERWQLSHAVTEAWIVLEGLPAASA
jgi:hypothetical protein